jgi:pimeloyl-ACP methyl ester carboxylesterase
MPGSLDRPVGSWSSQLMLTLRIPVARALMVALFGLATTATYAQQSPRNPVVFAHGIRSGADSWDVTAPALMAEWPVRAVRQTTPWTAPPAAQAATLAGLFSTLPDTTIAVAHSLGGIVLREAAKNAVPYRSMVTVGTLHSGAPAAYSVLLGSMAEIPQQLQASYTDLCIVYCGEEAPGIALDIAIATLGRDYLTRVWQVGVAALGFDSDHAVWQSMYPSSPYIQSVNSVPVLASVASHVPIRAAIRTRLHDPNQAMWRLAANEETAGTMMAIRDALVYSIVFMGISVEQNYCGAIDFEQFDANKCFNIWRFWAFANTLASIDAAYCARMQREGALGFSYDSCDESDGVVPFQRQLWGPSGYSRDIVVVGPSHVEQTKDPQVRDAIGAFFESTGLTRCGQGPSYQTEISGPTIISAGSTSSLAVHSVDRCDVRTLAGSPIPSASSQNPSVVSVVAVSPNAIALTGNSSGTALVHVLMNEVSSTVAVTVPPSSFASLSLTAAPAGPYLAGDQIEFSAQPITGSPVVSYEWRVDGGPALSYSPSYTHGFTGDAVVVCTLTTASGQTASAYAYVSGGGVSLRAPAAVGGNAKRQR